MPKLDRRVRRTRRSLRDALLDLIPQQGYDQITVQDITDHADLSRATFYLHYADKDDLLARSLEEMFDELIQALPGPLFRLPDADSSAGRPASLLIFKHVAAHQALYKALLIGNRGVHYVIYREIQYLALLAESQLGQLAPSSAEQGGLPHSLIAHHIAGSLFTLILWWLENDLRESPLAMARAWEELTLPGILRGLNVADSAFSAPGDAKR